MVWPHYFERKSVCHHWSDQGCRFTPQLHSVVMSCSRLHLRPLVHLFKKYPLESAALTLLAIGFIFNTINQPILWQPAAYVPPDQIGLDVFTCTPPASRPKNEFVCSIETDRRNRIRLIETVNDSLLDRIPADFDIRPGGFRTPVTCTPLVTSNIIVPFRNRTEQLNIFLQNMHPFLVQQQIAYQIFVIEQADGYRFNRGKLLNIGFLESMKIRPDACCFILHDVDLLPENINNVYACSKSGPRHMSAAVNSFRYNLLYRELFGGAIAVRKKDFKDVNGFSNMFYGWGGEDDDLSSRIRAKGLPIIRWDSSVSRYTMLKHRKEKSAERSITQIRKQTENNFKVSADKDGLSTCSYRILRVVKEPLFTRIVVTL